MEELQHDPRTKQAIKEMLYAYLYEPVEHHYKQRLDTIIKRNASINGYSHNSFVYKDEFYTCDTNKPPRKANRLDKTLCKAMDEYLKELKQLNEQELPYVLGFINQVLNSSNGLSDYLRVLPESVHYPLNKLIATCPCKDCKLTEETVNELLAKNTVSITLMKKRMAINLIT